MNHICCICLLNELMDSASLSSCGRFFHKVAPLYPNVLFRNSVLGFAGIKSVSLFRRLCCILMGLIFLRNRSFKFGAVWSLSILYISIDLSLNRLASVSPTRGVEHISRSNIVAGSSDNPSCTILKFLQFIS